jgi:hypothetical protein
MADSGRRMELALAQIWSKKQTSVLGIQACIHNMATLGRNGAPITRAVAEKKPSVFPLFAAFVLDMVRKKERT